MISPKALLTDLQKWVTKFENDLRQRCREVPELDASLKADWQKAKDNKRTAEAYEIWRDGQLTQSAVGWVLGCVFVRFLEDNQLLDRPWIAGGGDRRIEAEHVRDAYFSENGTLSDRDYLQHVFTEVGKLPGMADLFDRRHNALWRAGISGDAAAEFIAFWRKMDHDFTDAEWGTRFLGDLYQDLSEYAKKTFALLQTPEFIEEFILDRTLDPAIERFGYKQARMIDPTCGSGHFVLGGFQRLLTHWQKGHPEMNEREIARNALAGVAGVDINPFAVAIARFRLLLAAWKFCSITRLKAAPDFHVNLAVGDSLLHGRRFGELESNVGAQRTFDTEPIFHDELKHHYEVEDIEALHRILGQQYHAVVGNPPYITVKDRAVSELYRARFPSCHRKYSLSVPFMERFFDLAVKGDGTPQYPAGFVGQITANSFMKREFGKKLIEEYLPRWDLTHVLDTSGSYIPGHGTPTVILFGKNQPPVSGTIRTVLGIAGEPATPADPSLGLVWQAIVKQIDDPGSVSEWVSAGDSPRSNFYKHPWSIGGGGAAELKDELQESAERTLGSVIDDVGYFGMTSADEVFHSPVGVGGRFRIEQNLFAKVTDGDIVRDWVAGEGHECIFPYSDGALVPIAEHPGLHRRMWPFRTTLGNRATFDRSSYFQSGRAWWSWHQLSNRKLKADPTIPFGAIATHNHFALVEECRLYSQTARVIKLPAGCQKSAYPELLGLLNSSAACFWMKQVFHCKGSTVDAQGARQTTVPFEDFYDHDGTKLKQFPIPASKPTQLPTSLVQTSTALQAQSPAATLASWSGPESGGLRTLLAIARDQATRLRLQLIACQEELDWQIYEAFGLVKPADGLSVPEVEAMDLVDDLGLELGQRAFEIVLARKMAAGEVQTTWFARHDSTPITELPCYWPGRYRELVEKRIRRIETDSNIRLIEQPEYKRRWNTEPWDEQLKNSLRQWLLARLETAFFEGERIAENGQNTIPTNLRNGFAASREPRLCTTRQLADVVSHDPAFMQAASVYRDREDFDLPKLIQELVEDESVPFLPIQRYKDSGLRKRVIWERTWDLQRQEDQIETDVRKENADKGLSEEKLKPLIQAKQKELVGDIPVPPKYASTDFKKPHWWKLRGKLDVPKERWITYSGTDTPSVIAWAGWNHKQQAQALAGYYQDRKDQDGWSKERLAPLIAGLKDLLPWLKQWHNDIDPQFQLRMGDFYEGYLREQIHELGMNETQIEELRIGGPA
jgi:hypothetical protein